VGGPEFKLQFHQNKLNKEANELNFSNEEVQMTKKYVKMFNIRNENLLH
jgi:hypothetical protein